MSESRYGALPNRLPGDWQREAEQHELIASLLAAYVDGELPLETVSELDAHLAECPRCTREVVLQRQMAAGLGQIGGPVASAALHTRIRQTIAAAPLPPVMPLAPPSGIATRLARRWRWGAVVASAALLWWIGVTWQHAVAKKKAIATRVPAAIALTGDGSPLLDSITTQWQSLAEPLPGRDRDLDAVRRAIGVTLIPLAHPALALEAAWTTTAYGELIGALAYRYDGRLVVQYVLPEAALARAPSPLLPIDAAAVATRAGSVNMVLWRTPGGLSVLVGQSTLEQLRAFQQSP